MPQRRALRPPRRVRIGHNRAGRTMPAGTRDREGFFHSVFRDAPAPIFVVSLRDDGGYLLEAFNPAFDRAVGVGGEKIEGSRLEDSGLSEADFAALKDKYDQCVREDRVIEYEQELEMTGGRTWWTRIAPVHDEAGRITHLVGTPIDISEARRSEALLRRLIREQRLLSDCNMAIIRAPDEMSLLSETCRIIRGAGYSTACVCLGSDGYAGDIRVSACSTQKEPPTAELESPDGLPAMALRTKRASRVSNLAEGAGDVGAWCGRMAELGYRAGIALPLLDSDGMPLGALAILSVVPEDFAAGEVRIFQELADDVAYGLSSIRSQERHRRVDRVNSARLRLLQFASNHTIEELLEQTLDQAEELTGSVVGFYHFVDEDQASLTLQEWSTRTKAQFCTAQGRGAHYPIADAGVWVDCVYARKPVIHNDYASLAHKKGMPEGHAHVVRELVVPVTRGDAIKAILGVGNKPTAYGDEDIETVSLLADLAWEIADRKLAEDALKSSERKFRELFEESFDGLFVTTPEGHIAEFNKKVMDILGYDTADEVRALDLARDVYARSSDRAKVIAAVEETGTAEYDIDVKRKDGSVITAHCSLTAVRGADGRVTQCRGIMRDVTERRQADAATS
ncbi:MAG: GAF domain-containing protein [Coriobacteriales bacterium]|nr:GAF domain-containing protein [Coriobacteriales bacterium]